MVRVPRRDERREPPETLASVEDAARLTELAGPRLDAAAGVEWYDRPDNELDLAALTLCRLRRAAAGAKGGPRPGDDQVRAVLERASPETLVWLASRTISYMDESGFPEAAERWFPEDA